MFPFFRHIHCILYKEGHQRAVQKPGEARRVWKSISEGFQLWDRMWRAALLWIRSSWGENFEDMPWISAPKKGFWTETRKDEAFVTRWTFETLERCDKGFKRNLTSSWWSAWRPPTPPCCCWWAPWCWCWCWWRVARGGESSWSARGSSPTSTPTRWDENLRETIKSLHFETTTVSSPLITVHWVYRCGFYNHQRLSHLSFDWVSYHSPTPQSPPLVSIPLLQERASPIEGK